MPRTPVTPDPSVAAVTLSIESSYPTLVSYRVESSDQDTCGYSLLAVTYSKDGGLRTDHAGTDRVDDLNGTMFAELSELRWGVFGDRDLDSTFEVDATTGQIMR